MINNENPVSLPHRRSAGRRSGAPTRRSPTGSEIPDLKEEFDEELALFGPGTDSGTFDYFTEEINGEEGATRKDYNNVGENDNATVTGVEGAPGGMGYAGFSYYTENEGKLKALEVDNGKGCVGPSVETAQDGSYSPLSRPLFIYPSDAALKKPEVKAFVDYYLENVTGVAESVGFVPLTEEQLEESEAAAAEGRRLAPPGRDRQPVKGLWSRRGRSPRRLQAPSRRYGEKAIQGLLALCGILSVLTTTAIVISLIGPTIGFFEVVSIGEFFGTDGLPSSSHPASACWRSSPARSTSRSGRCCSRSRSGSASAIYLSEYATPRVRKTLKPVLEVLAGIPTVAIGFFAVSFLLPEIIQPIWPRTCIGGAIGKPFMALAASLGIGLMIVPIIASLSDDAMSAVPRGLREGAYAMGATKGGLDPGRLPGGALGHRRLDRAGDLARGRRDDDRRPRRRLDPELHALPNEAIQAMTSYIAVTATGDIPTGSIDYKSVFAVGSLLFLMTLAMNVISIRLVRKYREVYE